MSLVRLWISLLLLAGLTACTVGPDYLRPQHPVPKSWAQGHGDGVTTKPLDIVHWWTIFQDPVLTSLIEEAAKANLNVKTAEARIRQTRAQVIASQAAFWPAIGSLASTTYNRNSQNLTVTPSSTVSGSSSASLPPAQVTSPKYNLYEAGFDASWELDVFGGTRRAVEAARADLAASIEGRNSALVTLFGEVATNYIQLRGLQRQLQLTRQNIHTQEQTLDLTRVRYQAGLATELDVANAKAQLATTTAQVPALESQINQTIHRLGVLLGKEPEALLKELSKAAPIPVPPAKISTGLPSELLRRRPDIRLAERQLAAATARIGVAVASLYPQFSITGSLGLESLNSNNLLNRSSGIWSIGPAVNWPLFAGGQLLANIKVQNALQEQALYNYKQTILTGLEETEDSLVAYVTEQSRRLDLAQAVDANQRATDLSNELYMRGLTDFLNVLVAERFLFQTQLQLAQSEASVSADLVSLYKALGGGWELGPPFPEASQPGAREILKIMGNEALKKY